MKLKIIRVTLITILVGVGGIGISWNNYINNTNTPYDEIGIEINSRMPFVLRKYGCDKLKATFKGMLPPHGCAKVDDMGRGWL